MIHTIHIHEVTGIEVKPILHFPQLGSGEGFRLATIRLTCRNIGVIPSHIDVLLYSDQGNLEELLRNAIAAMPSEEVASAATAQS